MLDKIIIFGNTSTRKNKTNVSFEDFQKTIRNDDNVIAAEKEIINLHDKKLDGKNLPDLLIYREVPILWLFFMKIRPKFLELVSFISEFNDFIKVEKPTTIKIENDFRYFEIIKQICDSKKIEISFSKYDIFKFRFKEKVSLIKRKYGMKFLLKKKFKEREKIFGKYSKHNEINLENQVVFNAFPKLRQDTVNVQTENLEKGEGLIQNILDIVKKNHTICCLQPLYTVNEKQEILKQRLNSEFSWMPLEFLLKRTKSKERENFLKYFLGIVRLHKFQDLFEINGIKVGKEFERLFLEQSNALFLPFWLELIDSLYIVFSEQKPKAIFLPLEFEPSSQIFITICKKFNIKTIGIEHGLPIRSGNLWISDRLSKNQDNQMFPIPEKLLTFGKITKQVNINSGYQPNDVIVFGNPNYFNLDKIKQILAKKDLFLKFNLDKNKKIILFTTSGINDYYDKKIWEFLLDHFKSNKEFYLVLKLHPSDNSLIYEKMIRKIGNMNAKIVKENFYEILFISSILVSARSTTITDGMVFEKPIIEIKFDDKLSWILDDYENGVLKSNIENLGQNILKLLNDVDLFKKSNQKNQRLLVDLYNIPEKNPEQIIQNLLS